MEVPRSVAFKFGPPEVQFRLRPASIVAPWVAVPKTTMHENHLPTPRKNQIRLSGQSCVVQPITIPQRVNQPTNEHFRFRVGRPDSRHSLASFFPRQGVHPPSSMYVRTKRMITMATLLGNGHPRGPKLTQGVPEPLDGPNRRARWRSRPCPSTLRHIKDCHDRPTEILGPVPGYCNRRGMMVQSTLDSLVSDFYPPNADRRRPDSRPHCTFDPPSPSQRRI